MERRELGLFHRVQWIVPLVGLLAAGVILVVLSTIGGQLHPVVPTATPTGSDVRIKGIVWPTPVPINYAFYDYGNTDFQQLYPEAGPIGSLLVLPWRGIHADEGRFDWRAIDTYLEAAQKMTVTLIDGTVISKPVILQIMENESGLPSPQVGAPYPPLTPDSPIFFFQDYTPSWVRDRMRQPIEPITWVKSLNPLQIGRLDNDLGSYLAIGRPGSSPCGWPFVAMVPKYDNPIWLKAYKEMVYALGARYDKDPRVTAIIFGPGIDTEYGQATKPYFGCDMLSRLYQTSGMSERKYLETVIKPGPLNDIADWYRDAFPTKPIYLQFTGGGKIMIDILHADGHVPPIGLKQATLIEDNTNQWQSDGNGTIQLMMRYSDTHPIAWENAYGYTGGWPRSNQARYLSLLAALMSFPDYMDFVGGWVVDDTTLETGMFDFQRKYLGRTVTTTDEIWIAMRETNFWPPTGGAIQYGGWRGDFTYGLYRPEGIPGNRAVVITTTELTRSPFFLTYPITTHIYSMIARRTDMASGNPYMSFAADRRWQYWKQTPASVSSGGVWYDVTLKYIDLGRDTITVEYTDYQGVVRMRTIRKRDTRQWVTTTITLNDAYFAGQLPGGADLRIGAAPDQGGVDEIIHMVMVKAYRGVSPTPTPATPRPTRTPLPLYEQRVNAGGSLYIDRSGYVWAADQAYTAGSWGYVGGGSYTGVPDITDPKVEDPLLYKTERYWPEHGGYRFDVPNGVYEVELRFAEILRDGPNRRWFDVVIEGETVLKNLDLYAKVGFNKPYDVTFRTVVSDGQLNIDFIAGRDSAKVNALRVTYRGPVGEPTPQPSPTTIAATPVKPTATVTPKATATPGVWPTPVPTPTPVSGIERTLSELEERVRKLDEIVREIMRQLQ